MSQIYTTGPVNLYAGLGPAAAPVFLGWSGGQGARIKKRRFWQNVHTDVSGPQLPHDKAYLGELHSINIKLGRWNESVLRIIQDAPGARSALNNLRGFTLPTDLGGLAITQALAWPMWLQFSYGGGNVPAFNAVPNQMGAGYHYFACILADEDDQGGVTPRGIQLSIETLPVFNLNRVLNGVRGGFDLFDEDMTGLPVVD